MKGSVANDGWVGGSFELSILDSQFLLACDDNLMVRVLRQLWNPFAGESSSRRADIEIRKRKGSWDLRSFDARSEHDDFWRVTNQVSADLFQSAVRGMRRQLDFHAAVSEKDERLLLLAANSGVGKTTLTIELSTRHGWSYVSDDLAPLDLATARVAPFPKPLSIKDARSWDRFANSLPDGTPVPQKSFWIPATALRTAPPEEREATHLVFLNRPLDTSGAKLVTLSDAEAVQRSGQYVSSMTAAKVKLMTILCTRAATAELTFGDAYEAAALVDEWIAEERGR